MANGSDIDTILSTNAPKPSLTSKSNVERIACAKCHMKQEQFITG